MGEQGRFLVVVGVDVLIVGVRVAQAQVDRLGSTGLEEQQALYIFCVPGTPPHPRPVPYLSALPCPTLPCPRVYILHSMRNLPHNHDQLDYQAFPLGIRQKKTKRDERFGAFLSTVHSSSLRKAKQPRHAQRGGEQAVKGACHITAVDYCALS